MLKTLSVVAVLVLAGCGGKDTCTLEEAMAASGVPAGTVCQVAESGEAWCAWPGPDGCNDGAYFTDGGANCAAASTYRTCFP